MKRLLLMTALVLCVLLSPVLATGVGEKKTDSSEGATLTYWVALNPNISSVVQDFSQTAYFKEVMKRTGINIEFQHVSAANDNVMKEGFKLSSLWRLSGYYRLSMA